MQVLTHDAPPDTGNAPTAGTDPLVLAAWRKADPQAVPFYLVRNALLLPVAAGPPGAEHRGARAAPFWDRIAAAGPFSWVYEVEAALIAQLGRANPAKRRTSQEARAGIDTWITPRLVHRAVHNGWITWAPEETGLEDIENRIFPLTPDRVRELVLSSRLGNKAEITNRVMEVSDEYGYPLPMDQAHRQVSHMLQTGQVRVDTAGFFCLLPDRLPPPSAHGELALVGGLGPLDGIDLHRDGITRTLEAIEARAAAAGRPCPAWSDLVLGLSLAVRRGQLLAPMDFRRAACLFWSTPSA